jgi:transcription elongation factor Elf1
MLKKVIGEFEFETCPKCGKQAEWTGSEVDKESYTDSYCCKHCNSKYDINFDMYYKCHWIEE